MAEESPVESTKNKARCSGLQVNQMSPSVFEHYHASFDAIEVMRKYAVEGLQPTEGLLTNFLGVKIHPEFLPEVLRGREGQVEPVPIPANWHADIAEWGAALRAVDLAPGPQFVMAELGCGWGCWMSNTGVAARSRGLKPLLFGVEGDEGHCDFSRRCLRSNGFAEDEYTVVRGVVAARSGHALFPKQSRAGLAWGLEPVFDASPEQVARAKAKGTHDVLPLVGLEELLQSQKRVDLLHIDIQGGEGDLLEAARDVLDHKVAYIVVGTHSRQLEGRIFTIMLEAGWTLEMERPAILVLKTRGEPHIEVDGLQGWRNPRLDPKDWSKSPLLQRLRNVASDVRAAMRRRTA
jgi:hypothetical protein